MQTAVQRGSVLVDPCVSEDIEFDIARLRSIATVVIHLTMLLAINVGLLRLVHAVRPDWFPPKLAGLGFADEIQSRVDGAVAAHTTTSEGSTGRDLCVVLGFSGGQEGIDIALLQKKLPARFLGLCGACDGTMTGLNKLVKPLLDSPLRPSRAMLAINPFHLVVRPHTASLRPDDIQHAFDQYLLAARRGVLQRFGHLTDPRFRNQDPWRPMTKNYFGTLPESTIALRVEAYAARGYFDLSRYDVEERQSQELGILVEQLRLRGTEVTIVLMPVHPIMFGQLPQDAPELLRTRLARHCRGPVPPVQDYQQLLPAESFYDVSHLNEDGQRDFTNALLAAECFL